MKGPLDRTKVVLRHLPPTISQSNLVDHIDSRFSGRYHWFSFRPGKSRNGGGYSIGGVISAYFLVQVKLSDLFTVGYGCHGRVVLGLSVQWDHWEFKSNHLLHMGNLLPYGLLVLYGKDYSLVSPKHLKYARAYIDFNKPDDVIEFAEVFKGHVFVNEKGTQFRTIVEYAPSQRVPKQWSKKDGREGTILKDPEYLEFLEFLAKPVENLPSAEIQLERKEAERAGAPKEGPIVTPLMDFVRQKRAAKGGARRTVLNGKSSRRAGGMPSRNPVSGSSKRGSEKRTSTTMVTRFLDAILESAIDRSYVLRDSSKILGNKDKSTYSLARKQDVQQLNDKPINSGSITGNELLEGENGSTGSGKKKILLLKGKEKEIPNVFLWKPIAVQVSGGSLMQQNTASPDKTAAPKHNQQREASGKIIRSILLSRDTRQNQPSLGPQSELPIQSSTQERDKKPPRPPSVQSLQKDTNGAPEDKLVSNDLHVLPTEKQGRRGRNKDRPDRGVWTPLRRSDGLHSSDESLSLPASQTSETGDAAEGTHVESKQDMLVTRGGDFRPLGGGRGRHFSSDNGPYRHGIRRGSAYDVKEADGSSIVEGKSSKRGGSSGYGSNEHKSGCPREYPANAGYMETDVFSLEDHRGLSVLPECYRWFILIDKAMHLQFLPLIYWLSGMMMTFIR
ncbi:hypothetical protein SASPL_133979 [Salvia splendens]|uniref:UPF3 domain-containing protein n=1 Tax=Salvia splendens TaxID=180675 RepID=A0A8X8ZJM5_SALSN|nr:hypothetical protein SASPL_133979 [Salvia splendens]